MTRRSAREAATEIIRTLTAAGHQALLAGGCVRDLLLGVEPLDYDVATSAHPEEITRCYPRAQQVGAHFGVVIVRRYGHLVEVATFRTDGRYLDGRHPETVRFGSAREDAERRDFTINGMFYDVIKDEVLDYVHGRADLDAGLLQAIGNPEQRFEEDHLRMLRGVRLAARLQFEIEQETFEAIYNRAPSITRVSAERIRDELERILTHPTRRRGFDLLCETGLLLHLWPEARWSTAAIHRAGRALGALPASAGLPPATAALLHEKEIAEVDRVCRALTYSNRDRKITVWLLRHLSRAAGSDIDSLADLKLLMAGPAFDDLLSLLQATLSAHDRPPAPHDELLERSRRIPRSEVAPAPLITGDDLLAMGLRPGPAFKRILDDLYRRQLNLELVDRDAALAGARKLVGED